MQEWHATLAFFANAKQKGNDVFVQPIDAIDYPLEEREEMLLGG